MDNLATPDHGVPREVKARYIHGKLEPMEELALSEGEEVTLLVKAGHGVSEEEAKAAFERSAGSWEGTLDFEEFLADLKAGRKRQQRPPVDLE